MVQPIITTHAIRRVTFTTSRPWNDVVQALRTAAGRPSGIVASSWWPEETDAASIIESVNSRVGPFGLLLFDEQPQSEVLKVFAPEGRFCPKVTQFLIGNPIVAAEIYEFTPRVPLLVPPRIAVIELPNGKGTEIVYDIPSSVIEGEREEARDIARVADAKFEKLVRSVL